MDGRNKRAERTRLSILAACRAMMVEGEHRPAFAAVTDRAGVSTRSGFQHFRSVGELHAEAIDHSGVRSAVLSAVVGPAPSAFACSDDVALRIVRAVVLGKPVAD